MPKIELLLILCNNGVSTYFIFNNEISNIGVFKIRIGFQKDGWMGLKLKPCFRHQAGSLSTKKLRVVKNCVWERCKTKWCMFSLRFFSVYKNTSDKADIKCIYMMQLTIWAVMLSRIIYKFNELILKKKLIISIERSISEVKRCTRMPLRAPYLNNFQQRTPLIPSCMKISDVENVIYT